MRDIQHNVTTTIETDPLSAVKRLSVKEEIKLVKRIKVNQNGSITWVKYAYFFGQFQRYQFASSKPRSKTYLITVMRLSRPI